MTAQLYPFHGGLSMPSVQLKSASATLESIPMPKSLRIPLFEYWGGFAQPVVAIGEQVSKGQLLAKPGHTMAVPRFAPTSGQITHIDEQALIHPSGLPGACISLAPDGEDRWIDSETISDYQQLSREEILNRIYQSGVTGMGGGGFPVASKLATALKGDVSLLVINAVECEPEIHCDEGLMLARPDQIIAGMAILKHLLKPERCILAIKQGAEAVAESLREAINRSSETGIELIALPDIYPMGSEKLLIYTLTGIEMSAKAIPAQNGVVCQNVASATAIHDAVMSRKAVTSRIVSFSGDALPHPGNREVLIGTSLAEVLAHCGLNDSAPLRIFAGGPMTGYVLKQQDAPIDIHHNCFLATTSQAEPVQACINCAACSEYCPVKLLPQQMLWHIESEQYKPLTALNLRDCIECGVCDKVCPSNIPLTLNFRFAKSQLKQQQHSRHQAELTRQRFEQRKQRLQQQVISTKKETRKPALATDTDTRAALIQQALARVQEKNKAPAKEDDNGNQ